MKFKLDLGPKAAAARKLGLLRQLLTNTRLSFTFGDEDSEIYATGRALLEDVNGLISKLGSKEEK
jgi:hypothetical protein